MRETLSVTDSDKLHWLLQPSVFHGKCFAWQSICSTIPIKTKASPSVPASGPLPYGGRSRGTDPRTLVKLALAFPLLVPLTPLNETGPTLNRGSSRLTSFSLVDIE